MFACDGDNVVYDFKVKKDKLIPMSIEKMNRSLQGFLCLDF